MKIKKSFVIVFLITFLIGYASVLPTKKASISIETPTLTQEKLPEISIEQTIEQQAATEIIDWQEEDESKFTIKLLETGEGFHGDQIIGKSGEIWLGLFNEKSRYFLRSTKLKVRRVHDVVTDGEDKNIKTGKDVSVSGKNQPVFLLKNAKMLRDGEVKTVFINQSDEEREGLKNGYQRDFKFNSEFYSLRVENKISSEEYPGKGSKLILSHNGKEQILSYLKDGCNDCFWYLYWAGDIDLDGKLDFYFDLSWHYNVIDRKLFLSSQAEKGKLVKQVANFWTNGC